jgi:antitoxin component YwqK of YwqJK toxin-antitoxin module
MRLLIIIKLSLLPAIIFAQETKLVSKATPAYTEEYFVLKSDKKIKHGTYVKYKPSHIEPEVLESGNYVNGKKDGLWVYFRGNFGIKRGGKIIEIANSIRGKVNYKDGMKNGLWTSYYIDTVTSVAANVSKKETTIDIGEPNKLKQAGLYSNDSRVGEWISLDFNGRVIQKYNFDNSRLLYDASIQDSLQLNVNREALFVGGKLALRDALHNSLSINALKEIKQGLTILTIKFKVNASGMISDLTISNIGDNDILKNHIQDLISSTNGQWIPSLKDGKKTEFLYQINFKIIKTNTKSVLGPNFQTSFDIAD